MKKLLLAIILLAPFVSFGATTTVPWITPTSTSGFIQPNKVNGIDQSLSVLSTGTSTFSGNVQVNGNLRVTGASLFNLVSSGTLTMNGNIALNGNYLSGDGGNEGVFVGSTGNVGIGTTSPSSLLTVFGYSDIIITGSSSPAMAGTYKRAGTYFGYSYWEAPGVGYIWKRNGGAFWIMGPTLGVETAYFHTSFTDDGTKSSPPSFAGWSFAGGASGTITSVSVPVVDFTGAGGIGFNSGPASFSSRVGFGRYPTTNPVEIQGRLAFVDAASNLGQGMQLYADSSFIGNIEAQSSSFGLMLTAAYSNGYVKIKTAGTERFIVNGSGNVGIGTTTPSQKLDVNGNIQISTSSSTAGAIYQNGSRLLHTYGTQNSFVGVDAGNFTLSGTNNTGGGYSALASLTSGSSNVAFGRYALRLNTTGSANLAFGQNALASNTIGTGNSAIGTNALTANLDGIDNVAIGNDTAVSNTSGSGNVFIGYRSGRPTLANANTTGTYNTYIGYSSGSSNTTQHTNATALGNGATVSDSNQVVIGNDSILTTILKGNVGIGTTTPNSKLTVENGDVYIASSTRGIILKSPDGTCARGTIDNSDVLTFSSVTCP